MFIESPRFPDDISLGVSGGPEFKTDSAMNPGGFRVDNRTREYPIHKVDAAHGVRTREQFDVLKALFLIVGGKWGGFRFKDWSDFQFDFSTGVLLRTTPGLYQLTKLYRYGAEVFVRPLKKPVPDTVSLQRGGLPISPGSAPGNFALDTATGLVSLVPDATVLVSAISVGSSTTVTLQTAVTGAFELTLSGFGGADASVVNDQSFPVVGVSGLQYTLAVDTMGKAITAGGPAVTKQFPGASELFTAAGEFDVAMKFDTDLMQASMDYSKKLHTWSQIPLVEWKNPA